MTYSVIKIEKERREIIMYNYDYDDCNSYEIREDWEEEIRNIIQSTVDTKCNETIGRNAYLSNELTKKEKTIQELNKDIQDLKNKLNQFENFNAFMKIINKENIISIINGLGLKEINSDDYISGMSNECISPYLRLIIKYYDDRDIVLKLFKAIQVEDINNLEKFILPRDYDKDLIKEIINDISNRTIQTNCCYLGGNLGFWIERNRRDFSTQKLSREVPLQEVFMNKYIVELFDDILKLLSKGNKILFEITKYQDFIEEQILQLSKYLIIGDHKKLNKSERSFINRHKNILFNDDSFCNKYFEYADDNPYDTFAIHNFNKKYQIKYLKNIEFKKAMEIINRINCNDEIKKEIIKKMSV